MNMKVCLFRWLENRRIDMSDTAAQGAGLGMTIVKYMIEAHNGTIHVESKPGKGTTVKFTILLK